MIPFNQLTDAIFLEEKQCRPYPVVDPDSGKSDPQATTVAFRAMAAREQREGAFHTPILLPGEEPRSN